MGGIAAGEFDHLVRSHQRRVFKVLFSLLRDQALADNLPQDCFLLDLANLLGYNAGDAG
jgi:DNA-directed RNA polymerase specialized sigma24 family protein